jgi:pyruvate dehydrogenase E1 component alpha subunit
VVDGQDVERVYEAVGEAVARARAGDGPSLLEMKTYRYRGHSRTDPAKYRPAGELESWKARDPIDILVGRLGLAASEVDALRGEAQQHIDEVSARAAEAPYPTLEETRPYVYAG